MLYFLCDSFERINKHSFSMLYLLCDSFERIDKHSFFTICSFSGISSCFEKNYFFEFFRRLHKPTLDQANLPVLYHHFKKKVDNKIAPELKSF